MFLIDVYLVMYIRLYRGKSSGSGVLSVLSCDIAT